MPLGLANAANGRVSAIMAREALLSLRCRALSQISKVRPATATE